MQVDKTKLNAKSSTKAEVVGLSNSYLPNVIWAKMFLAEQGYELTDNDFYQDNQSAIRLEKNGRASCRQKSRHINIGYFFMKDRFVSENISVVYCPTEEMLANFFKKPLQGSLFRKFCDVLLGHCHVHTLIKSLLSPSEDRAENPISKKVRSGGSVQTLKIQGKYYRKEAASAPTGTYASIVMKKID